MVARPRWTSPRLLFGSPSSPFRVTTLIPLRSHHPLSSHRPVARTVILLVVMAAAVAGLALRAPSAGADQADQPRYLALGGSASLGVQPTIEDPRGVATRTGYANDLEAMARSRWPGLELTQLGCPGESTTTMMAGGDRCPYPEGSQLAAADAFLRAHHDTRLVTIDLGFNDISGCIANAEVDSTCLSTALASIRQHLAAIVSSLQSAADSRAVFVGVGHYDPYLAAARKGGADLSYATGTLRAIDELDDTLRSVYTAAGVTMADVLTPFDGGDAAGLSDGHALVASAERVCGLTWMCAAPPFGPDVHPDDRGYSLIAQQLSAAIDQKP